MSKRLIPIIIIILIGSGCSGEQSKEVFLPKYLSTGFTNMEKETIEIELLEGKVVILNLWATWCKPCIEEMPALEKLQGVLPEDYLLVLASDEEFDKVRKFTLNHEYKLNFVQIDKSLESLGVYSLPTTLIIGADGVLKETIVGAQDWDSPEQLQKIVEWTK